MTLAGIMPVKRISRVNVSLEMIETIMVLEDLLF